MMKEVPCIERYKKPHRRKVGGDGFLLIVVGGGLAAVGSVDRVRAYTLNECEFGENESRICYSIPI